MENEKRQGTLFFNRKQKTWEKNMNNRGKNTKKTGRKKTENNKKYRNETRQDFSESRFPREEITSRFWEMLKTKTRSS